MSVTNQRVNIKELKDYVTILEKKLNDIGYNYFLLTNDEFELDIEFIKTFFKNNCNNSAKWIFSFCFTSSISTFFPSSRSIEVTSLSSMPHGMMFLK